MLFLLRMSNQSLDYVLLNGIVAGISYLGSTLSLTQHFFTSFLARENHPIHEHVALVLVCRLIVFLSSTSAMI
jgi:hypothetical protein